MGSGCDFQKFKHHDTRCSPNDLRPHHFRSLYLIISFKFCTTFNVTSSPLFICFFNVFFSPFFINVFFRPFFCRQKSIIKEHLWDKFREFSFRMSSKNLLLFSWRVAKINEFYEIIVCTAIIWSVWANVRTRMSSQHRIITASSNRSREAANVKNDKFYEKLLLLRRMLLSLLLLLMLFFFRGASCHFHWKIQKEFSE